MRSNCEFGHTYTSKTTDDVEQCCVENTMKLTSLGHLLRILVELTACGSRVLLESLILFVLFVHHVNCEA